MSDVTDINGLIERLKPIVKRTSAVDLWGYCRCEPPGHERDCTRKIVGQSLEFGSNDDARFVADHLPDIIIALRTLAERQGAPSSDVLEAAWEAYQNTSIDLCGDTDDEYKKCVANAVAAALASTAGDTLKAAEQRGADRAFEEAAVIAREVIISDWGSAGRQTADSATLAIRQRMGAS